MFASRAPADSYTMLVMASGPIAPPGSVGASAHNSAAAAS
jgi:hypothetical protein